jgi:hypothetical protein
MGGRKSVPADQKSDRIIGGLGNGIQKRNVLCPDWFDIVHKSGQKKREKREEKGEREKYVGKDKAGKAEKNTEQNKRDFFNLSFYQRPIPLGGMMNIEGSIGDFVNDVIGCRNRPCEKKGQQRPSDKGKNRKGRDL